MQFFDRVTTSGHILKKKSGSCIFVSVMSKTSALFAYPYKNEMGTFANFPIAIQVSVLKPCSNRISVFASLNRIRQASRHAEDVNPWSSRRRTKQDVVVARSREIYALNVSMRSGKRFYRLEAWPEGI